MKNLLLATVALSAVCATAAIAADGPTLYGQVNKSLVVFDDGRHTDVAVVDNIYSSTRTGLKGEQGLDNGLTASYLLEYEIVSNASSAMTQNATAGQSSTPLGAAGSFNERQANVGLTGKWGGVYLGQLSTAVDGVFVNTDLAGAGDVLGAEYRYIGGGLKFQKEDSTGLTTFTVANLTETQYTSRQEAVRYNSPVINGFSAKAAFVQGGDYDAAAFYEGKLGDFKTKAAAGFYVNNDLSATAGTNVIGSKYFAIATARHSSGLGATVAYSRASLSNDTPGSDDPSYLYGKLGYARDAWEIAADLGKADHYQSATLAKNSLTTYGLAGQYNLGHGVSVAAYYRNFDADVTGTATEALNLYGLNMRVKF